MVRRLACVRERADDERDPMMRERADEEREIRRREKGEPMKREREPRTCLTMTMTAILTTMMTTILYYISKQQRYR
jgi:hypothetical protein